VAAYLIGVRQADKFLRVHSTTIQAATRADLEAFMADLLARRAASTAATYYKVLKILYGWLVEEEEIAANPMARMKPPIVPDKPVPIVPEDGLKRLLRVCAGNTFEARRDTALIMLLLDTGARRAEMVGLTLDDVDLELDASWSLARAAASAPCRLAVGPARRWTATSAPASATSMPPCRGCGWGRRADSLIKGW
jgi:site-specific recombinase XerD